MSIARRHSVLTTVLSVTILGAIAFSLLSSGVGAQVEKPDGGKAAQQDTEKEKGETLSDFMAYKMDASSLILEGLLVDNPKLILKGAKKLQEMGKAAKWRVSNDMMYRHHSEEFQTNVDKLIAAAKGDSLDRSALVWFDLTLSCIDCHRWVRTVLIADAPDGLGLQSIAQRP